MKEKLYSLLEECVNKIELTNPHKYSRFGRYTMNDLTAPINVVKSKQWLKLEDFYIRRLIEAADSI